MADAEGLARQLLGQCAQLPLAQQEQVRPLIVVGCVLALGLWVWGVRAELGVGEARAVSTALAASSSLGGWLPAAQQGASAAAHCAGQAVALC